MEYQIEEADPIPESKEMKHHWKAFASKLGVWQHSPPWKHWAKPDSDPGRASALRSGL